MSIDAKSKPTIFLYTEEQRGNQLVESSLIGSINDISSIEKLVVVQDPHSGLKLVYTAHFDSHNLDAVGITDLPDEKFDGKSTAVINDSNYRLGTPEQAMKHLRNRTQWIQDKGSVLSVLLHYAASRRHNVSAPRSINRDRRTSIPPGTPVETLEDALAVKAAAAAALADIEAQQAQPAETPAETPVAPPAETPPADAS